MTDRAESYLPLEGVKVLDIGILIPANQCSVKLSALGADVVKVEPPGLGDRIRYIGAVGPNGENGHHQSQARGKRSIALDLRRDEDVSIVLQLAQRADVLVENFLPGRLGDLGLDPDHLRATNPGLVICSITGFGQTGPLAGLPSHGLNMDALADSLNLEWHGAEPRLGKSFTSWGNELGSTYACYAIVAALLARSRSGEGAWIDLSAWDTIVEAHRAQIAEAYFVDDLSGPEGADAGGDREFYNTYQSRDGRAVLLGALEKKFWINFCRGVGREDLIDRHTGKQLEFDAAPGPVSLRQELSTIFATADADEWDRRFLEWDCPGCTVLSIHEIMRHPHFAARNLVQGATGSWPNIASAIRWQHTGERAGTHMGPPPAVDEHRAEILADWLS